MTIVHTTANATGVAMEEANKLLEAAKNATGGEKK
jgi:hypothetical protein